MRLPDIASSSGPIKISMQIIASYAHYFAASREQLAAAPYIRARDLSADLSRANLFSN